MHPHYSSILMNIGVIYNDKRDYDSALNQKFKSLRIMEFALGQFHPNYANCLDSIGKTYFKKIDFDKAL